MKINPEFYLKSIQSTLRLLLHKSLLIHCNQVILKHTNQVVKITWPNHVSGDINYGYFNNIEQYRVFLTASAYTCLLIDGSILRVCYEFKRGELVRHSLLFWPAPFPITTNDLIVGGLIEIFDLYSMGQEWQDLLIMRTPMRFDYDPVFTSAGHPNAHLHMQNKDCRVALSEPMCFNRFVKFIFRTIYPEIYIAFDFWDDLEITNFVEKEEKSWSGQYHLRWQA